MNIDDILELWSKDSQIDPNELAHESNSTPQLHAKYLKMLFKIRDEYTTEQHRLRKLKLDKFEYYSGRMSTDELNKRKWKPFPHKILKNDIDQYIQGDDDIIILSIKLTKLKEMIEAIESILDRINKRSFDIKNSIEFLKFTNGLI